MSQQQDPYASEAETAALLRQDTRTIGERQVDELIELMGGNEQGVEIDGRYMLLRKIAAHFIERQATTGTPLAAQPAPVQEPAWYHAECNDPDYSRFTQEKDEAFAIVSDKGGHVTELYTRAQPAPDWIDDEGRMKWALHRIKELEAQIAAPPATQPAPVQEPCSKCHGLGYYDEGHENDDGSMSGGNYVDCEKCKPPAAPVQEPKAWQSLPAGKDKALHQALAALRGPVADGLARRCAIQSIEDAIAATPPAAQPADQGQSCYCPNCEALSKQLAAQPTVPANPKGWKLVPVKPTCEMVDAGVADLRLRRYNRALIVAAIECYAAMLAAAPEKGGAV